MTQRCCVIDNGICGFAANSGVQPVTQRCCVSDIEIFGFAVNFLSTCPFKIISA